MSKRSSHNMRAVVKLGKIKVYKKPFIRWEGLATIMIGVIAICTLFNARAALRDGLFLPGAVSANGTIIACQIWHTSKGQSYCEATIRFETQSGQQITFNSAVGSSQEGDSVPIIYHPGTPEDARVDTLSSDLGFAGFFSGLLFICLGLFWHWKRRITRVYILKQKGFVPKQHKWARRRKQQIKRHLG